MSPNDKPEMRCACGGPSRTEPPIINNYGGVRTVLCGACGHLSHNGACRFVRSVTPAPPPSADGEAGKVLTREETRCPACGDTAPVCGQCGTRLLVYAEIAALRAEVDAWKVAEVETRVTWKRRADNERLRADKAEAEVERLKQQLPEGMEHCTIQFKACAKGHGWLTATNWTQHGCPTCANERLRAAIEAAPHALNCAITCVRAATGHAFTTHCDCWKSKACAKEKP